VLLMAQLQSVNLTTPVVVLSLQHSQKSAVALRYWSTLFAAVIWLVNSQALDRQRVATAYDMSGRVASAAYIKHLTIAC
jgi:hypothetical protein